MIAWQFVDTLRPNEYIFIERDGKHELAVVLGVEAVDDGLEYDLSVKFMNGVEEAIRYAYGDRVRVKVPGKGRKRYYG